MRRDVWRCRYAGIGLCLLVALIGAAVAQGQQAEQQPLKVPSSEDVTTLLGREPMTLQSWPAWRKRLMDWIDDRSEKTTAAYYAGWEFVKSQADSSGKLPAPLDRDAFAYYLLGRALEEDAGNDRTDRRATYAKAEGALRQSVVLDGNFARSHCHLALVLMHSTQPKAAAGQRRQPDPRLAEAAKELDTARRVDPKLPLLAAVDGQLALMQDRPAQAEGFFRQALREDPRPEIATGVAWAVILNRELGGGRAKRVEDLVRQFPESGELACLHAVCLAQDEQFYAAGRELRRARQLGADPATVLPASILQDIEKSARTWLLIADFGWLMLTFTASYAVLMVVMAGFGYVLARRTRGSGALALLGDKADEFVAGGQVQRSGSESTLARLYALGLIAGLILFYVAVPFILAGLLAATGLMLYGIFLLPRIPIKLVIIVVVVGLGMAWAVLKSVFSRPGKGNFGLSKTATDCPRLYQLLGDVAQRLETKAVDEVYLAPGSSIGVHQEGRGPFGIFGVSRRVLTVGLSTMHFLTVSELQSILAHEYAHFSHRDTFYNRFIYQVQLSIGQALQGMGASGGKLNYVNPFYWFLYLYYKAYNLLSAGFSRSREFLADRMACCLYGSDVFASALEKVCTDGTLFEMTIYDNIGKLLAEDKAFVNMYAAFRSFRDEQMTAQDRNALYKKLLEEKESLFASHPTFQERIDAVDKLPRAVNSDNTPALQLFDQPEEIEKELTEFLTAYVYHMQRLQAQAAAASR
jgi:Zn-dependent protease with chaperone function